MFLYYECYYIFTIIYTYFTYAMRLYYFCYFFLLNALNA